MSDEQFAGPQDSDQAMLDYLNDLLPSDPVADPSPQSSAKQPSSPENQPSSPPAQTVPPQPLQSRQPQRKLLAAAEPEKLTLEFKSRLQPKPRLQLIPPALATGTAAGTLSELKISGVVSPLREEEIKAPQSGTKTQTTGEQQGRDERLTPAATNWLANGRPVWGQKPFECLLFEVAGLNLAVPLVTLGGVYAFQGKLTKLFGMPDWFLGLFQNEHNRLGLIDTALWIMPERYNQEWLTGMNYVIRLGDSEWGIGSTDIVDSFTLDPGQVKWRTRRVTRPWLAGTLITRMCALVDVEAMLRVLVEKTNRKA